MFAQGTEVGWDDILESIPRTLLGKSPHKNRWSFTRSLHRLLISHSSAHGKALEESRRSDDHQNKLEVQLASVGADLRVLIFDATESWQVLPE